MEIQSSILPWRIPWTEKPGRPYSPVGRKESDMTKQLTLTLFFTLELKSQLLHKNPVEMSSLSLSFLICRIRITRASALEALWIN